MKNAELIARLRLGASISRERKLNQGYDAVADEAADAIEALEAQLKNASVAAIAEAAEVDRLQAEVERLTTLTRGQHIELYNARLQLAAAQGQEPAFWLNEQGQLCATRGYAERHSVGQKLIPLFAAPIPQHPAQPLTDKQIEHGWKQTFSTENPFCPCNLKSFTKAVRWALAAAPQPKETK